LFYLIDQLPTPIIQLFVSADQVNNLAAEAKESLEIVDTYKNICDVLAYISSSKT